MTKRHDKLDKIIDGIILALKVVGGNSLFFGIFLILEGLSLIFAPSIFPIFVVLSIMIAFAFAIEWFFNVLRSPRTVWNIIQRIFIIILIIALLVYCGFMIFDELFRFNVDRVIVCATTIIDGTKNLLHVSKTEHQPTLRKVFSAFCIICISYGAIYGIVGGAEANIFTTTLHGIVFIFCGLTDIWLFVRAGRKI